MREKRLIKGTVIDTLPGTMFSVEIAGGKIVLCAISGKMRIHNIRVLKGDSVDIVLAETGDRGRIEKRYK